MAERVSGQELIEQVSRSMKITMTLSNVCGALIVFLYLTLLLPGRHLPPVGDVLELNWAPGLTFMLASTVLAWRLGRAVIRGRFQWLRDDRAPTRAEQRSALRNPFAQVKVCALIWLVAAVVFGLINLHFSAEIASGVAMGIVLGGVVTCAVSYLLAERVLRPVTARALEYGVPLTPVAPGVIARTVLAWATATAVPVIAIADEAFGLVNGDAPRTATTGWSLVVLAVIGLATGALAMVMAAKSIAEPIRSVRHALAHVEEGRTDVGVEVNDASEVGLLQAGFNRMASGLRERERLRDLFGRHVGEDVARRALEEGVELGGELREAAVLFVDVVGSTRLAATTDPQEVVRRLNRFFGIVLEVVRRHGGLVNKFEGDAAVCVFGVPTSLDDPAGCALAAARELCVRLETDSPLQAGIGVSAGEVVAGNVGAAERFEYTVIGDPVNEAARLTEAAKRLRPRLLASGRALGRAAPAEAVHWQLDGEQTLTGRSEPTVLARPARSVQRQVDVVPSAESGLA